jgi:hypothetical protein
MAIYLHPIHEDPDLIEKDSWVEIDLVSWDENKKDAPIHLTLVRKLEKKDQKPYLQNLMFENLYKGIAIKELKLELPLSPQSDEFELQILEDIKVTNYSINPSHPNNKNTYEKVSITAKSKRIQT